MQSVQLWACRLSSDGPGDGQRAMPRSKPSDSFADWGGCAGAELPRGAERGLSQSFEVHGSLGLPVEFAPPISEGPHNPERHRLKAEAPVQGRLQGPALRGDADRS